jgi:hypothetical protein
VKTIIKIGGTKKPIKGVDGLKRADIRGFAE